MFRAMRPSTSELRTIPLFHGFGDAELAEIAARFARVATTAPLFEVGEAASTLYVLTHGEVVLDRPGDDLFRLRPPALIGELGALTGLPRSTRATATADAIVWGLEAKALQSFLGDHQELGVRFLVNLLSVVADKVHRDQGRLAEMRGNLMRTQKELKRLRELVLEKRRERRCQRRSTTRSTSWITLPIGASTTARRSRRRQARSPRPVSSTPAPCRSQMCRART